MSKRSTKSTSSADSTTATTSNEKLEILINGRFYNVTGFKHPGGSIIKYYTNKNIDATQGFNQFHIRSKKAQKMLENWPSREATPAELKQFYTLNNQQQLLADFEELTQQLRKEGYFNPSFTHTLYRLTEIILMHVVGLYLVFHQQYLLGLMILGIVSGRCGWLMHEGKLTSSGMHCMSSYHYDTGGHYSMTSNIAIDTLLQIMLYGVGCGMSGSWWRIQHNKHHSMPQKVGHDVDLDTLPLVAFTKRVVQCAGFSHRAWLSVQAVMFPVITTLLVALGWQFYLHPRHILRTKNWKEGLALLTRYALIAYFIGPHFGLWGTIKLYLAYTWFGANYIFIDFAVSHTHLPVVERDNTSVSYSHSIMSCYASC